MLKLIMWILRKRYRWATVMVVDGTQLKSESQGQLTINDMIIVCEACDDIQQDLVAIAQRDLEIRKVEAGVV